LMKELEVSYKAKLLSFGEHGNEFCWIKIALIRPASYFV